jgi:hypothetical protein
MLIKAVFEQHGFLLQHGTELRVNAADSDWLAALPHNLPFLYQHSLSQDNELHP